jgi:hypothetical protein
MLLSWQGHSYDRLMFEHGYNSLKSYLPQPPICVNSDLAPPMRSYLSLFEWGQRWIACHCRDSCCPKTIKDILPSRGPQSGHKDDKSQTETGVSVKSIFDGLPSCIIWNSSTFQHHIITSCGSSELQNHSSWVMFRMQSSTSYFFSKISLIFPDNSSILKGFWIKSLQPRSNMSVALPSIL